MKNIIKKAVNDKVITKDKIIIPQFEDGAFNDDFKPGVGLFPDRFICKGKVNINNLKGIISCVINDFADKVNVDLKEDIDTKPFFQKYFRVIPISVELEDTENAIIEIYKYLDNAELKQKINPAADDEKFLIRFLEKYEHKYNFLHRLEFGDRKFKSTAEIATAEFTGEQFYNDAAKNIKHDKENNQKEYFEEIKTGAGKQFRNYQKYIAVVQADGDNFGEFIKQLYAQTNKEDLLKQFSLNLWDFGIDAVEAINKYKGSPVYAGGDDLLFFCPVAHTKVDDDNDKKVIIDKTFFTLLDDIDGLFKQYFTDYNENGIDFKTIIENLDKKPSMSYGVSISYYKFPLNEALELGAGMLFSKAKQTCRKNAVSYAVLKHSGQYYGTTFHKFQNSYATFKKLLKNEVNSGEFIHSVAQKLEPQSAVIFEIGKVCEEEERNKMFDNFFDNNFDESIHLTKNSDGTKELIPFLKNTKQLFKDIYTENPIRQTTGTGEAEIDNEQTRKHKANLEKIYASLRFMEFINNNQER